MARNFYYGRDAAVVAAAARFAAGIQDAYADYGLTLEQATSFGARSAALQSAYAASVAPSTRTSIVVAEKNSALLAMRAEAIRLSRIIYSTESVDDAQLIGLGMLPRPTRSTVRPATTAPVLRVASVVGRLVHVRLHDAETGRRALARGAASANLYSYVGENSPANPRDYQFEGGTTRARAVVQFRDEVPSGATVWLAASWVGTRGQIGTACPPVMVTLQGGPVLASAA